MPTPNDMPNKKTDEPDIDTNPRETDEEIFERVTAKRRQDAIDKREAERKEALQTWVQLPPNEDGTPGERITKEEYDSNPL